MISVASGMSRWGGACALAALSLVALSLVPVPLVFAGSAGASTPRHAAPKAAKPVAALSPTFGAFTPAAADPRLAAAFARSGLGSTNFAGGAFRFTPSGGSSRRAITVAVRARAAGRPGSAAVATELAPSAYSLGVSVGWERFALSGDVARTDGGLLRDTRESADVGFSLLGKRWATRLDLTTERATGEQPALVGVNQSYSLGLGGSYSLTHNFDVTGGVRYKTQRDQLNSLISDERRDSQAVYFGTTYRF